MDNPEQVVRELLERAVRKHDSEATAKGMESVTSPFDLFVDEVCSYSEAPATTMAEIRNKRKQTTTKGILFECFCKLYLKTMMGYEEVWLRKEVPEDVRIKLGLETHDVGIDLVAHTSTGYVAVQAKFKSSYRKQVFKGQHVRTNAVNWTEVSTFYALLLRTGPWERYVVVTNGSSVRRMGNKNKKDLSICQKRLQSLTSMEVYEMLGKPGQSLVEPVVSRKPVVSATDSPKSKASGSPAPRTKAPTSSSKRSASKRAEPNQTVLSIEELREKRLAALERYATTKTTN